MCNSFTCCSLPHLQNCSTISPSKHANEKIKSKKIKSFSFKENSSWSVFVLKLLSLISFFREQRIKNFNYLFSKKVSISSFKFFFFSFLLRNREKKIFPINLLFNFAESNWDETWRGRRRKAKRKSSIKWYGWWKNEKTSPHWNWLEKLCTNFSLSWGKKKDSLDDGGHCKTENENFIAYNQAAKNWNFLGLNWSRNENLNLKCKLSADRW